MKARYTLPILFAAVLLLGGFQAKAASFVNGGFETADLTGWTTDTPSYGYNPFGTSYGVGMEGSHWA